MLGIPTRTDAMAIDADYAELIRLSELKEKVSGIKDIMSDIFLHNHVAEAFRDTDHIEEFAKACKWSITEMSPNDFPEVVEYRLKPELVIGRFLNGIDGAERILEEVRNFLDKESYFITSDTRKSLDGVYEIIRAETVPWDYVPTPGGIKYAKGEGVGRKYTYNSYEVAKLFLSNLREALKAAYSAERNSGARAILAIGKVITDYKEGPNYEFIDHLDSDIPMDKHPFSREEDPNTPTGKLREENRKIAHRSDIFLRFDEVYFHIGNHGIPSAAILNTERRFSYYTLSFRVDIRHLVEQILKRKQSVIINGVTYTPSVMDISGKNTNIYMVNGDSCQEISNLLAKPVREIDSNRVIIPEEWAAEEARLVNEYHQFGKKSTTITALLKIYDCDTSNGNPTREKKVEQLKYSLKVKDTNWKPPKKRSVSRYESGGCAS